MHIKLSTSPDAVDSDNQNIIEDLEKRISEMKKDLKVCLKYLFVSNQSPKIISDSI